MPCWPLQRHDWTDLVPTALRDFERVSESLPGTQQQQQASNVHGRAVHVDPIKSK